MAANTPAIVPTPRVGVFFSPPEAPKSESFTTSVVQHQPVETQSQAATSGHALPSFRSLFSPAVQSPLSPPVSPATKVYQDIGQPHSRQRSRDVNDYELFPRARMESQDETTSPLFRPMEADADQDPVHLHMQARNKQGISGPAPSRQDYDLAVSFKSKVIERYKADPAGWLSREIEYNNVYPPRWITKQSEAALLATRKADTDGRITKRQRQAPKTVAEKLPVPKRAPRPSPRVYSLDDFDAQPVVKHRRKVSRATPTPREDMDYRLVPDYSPPVSTIAPGKNLKIEWKGHPLDLSTDPDRHMLDDAEVSLAAVLRLTGAQYLYAKRKIFEKYIELARVGKDLNKTSAQGVCKIDVNKASKLWIAFEKVGWFDRRHFSAYL